MHITEYQKHSCLTMGGNSNSFHRSGTSTTWQAVHTSHSLMGQQSEQSEQRRRSSSRMACSLLCWHTVQHQSQNSGQAQPNWPSIGGWEQPYLPSQGHSPHALSVGMTFKSAMKHSNAARNKTTTTTTEFTLYWPELQPGDPVLIKCEGEKGWKQPATVRGMCALRSYIVETATGGNLRRNRNHLCLQTRPATPWSSTGTRSSPWCRSTFTTRWQHRSSDDSSPSAERPWPRWDIPHTNTAAGASRSLSGFVRSSVCMCFSCGWYPVFISSAVDGILYSFLQLWTVSCIHFSKSNTIQHACACSYSQWMCQSVNVCVELVKN